MTKSRHVGYLVRLHLTAVRVVTRDKPAVGIDLVFIPVSFSSNTGSPATNGRHKTLMHGPVPRGRERGITGERSGYRVSVLCLCRRGRGTRYSRSKSVRRTPSPAWCPRGASPWRNWPSAAKAPKCAIVRVCCFYRRVCLALICVPNQRRGEEVGGVPPLEKVGKGGCAFLQLPFASMLFGWMPCPLSWIPRPFTGGSPEPEGGPCGRRDGGCPGKGALPGVAAISLPASPWAKSWEIFGRFLLGRGFRIF